MIEVCRSCGGGITHGASFCTNCGAQVESTGRDSAARTVGRFGLVRELGSGGFGTVWEGVDTVSGRPVAVKLLDRMGADAVVVREQLLAEAAALRSVDSPHTLRVVDVVDDGGVLALVTDLVPGVSLRALLDEHGTLSGQDALVVLRGAALGLAAVHQAGLVHGDVKPANMLVEADGSSRLIDFGLASLPGWVGEDALSPWGSPAYAPPEQVAHGLRDHRSDIYSLTVTLFEVLCGQRPFTGDTLDELRLNHVQQPLPDPRLFVPDLGDGLTQLILWGLAKDPAQRPQDVATWLQYLEAAAEAKYGPGWAVPAGVGAVAGGMLAGGLVASGVLAPATGSTLGAAAAGAGTGGAGAAGAGAAGGSAAGAGAAPGVMAGAGGSAKSALFGSFATKAVVAVAATATVAVCGVGIKVVLDDRGTIPPGGNRVVEKLVLTDWEDGGKSSVVMVDPDGTHRVKIADGANGVISPDGRTIAFENTQAGISTVSIAGGEPRIVVTAAKATDSQAVYRQRAGAPEWLPDGRTIAYVVDSNITIGDGSLVEGMSDTELNTAIRLAKVDGAPAMADDGELVTASEFELSRPSVADDGQLIYSVVTYRGEDRGSFIVRTRGGRPEKLTDSDGVNEPTWSPDAQSVAYKKTRGGLRIMSAGGTDDRGVPGADRAGSGFVNARTVVWSPDGRRVSYSPLKEEDFPDRWSARVVDVATGEQSLVINRALITDWAEMPAGLLGTTDGEPTTDAEETAAAAWSEETTFDPPLVFDSNGKMLSGDARVVAEMPASWKTLVRWNGDNCPPNNFRLELEKYHPDGFVMGRYLCSGVASWAIWSNRSGPWEMVAGGNGDYDCPTLEEVLQWKPPTDWNACV